MKLFLGLASSAVLLFATGLIVFADNWEAATYMLGLAIYGKLLEMQR